MARYRDPHLDPLRAPTRRGQHPYAVREDPSRNPQHMYETRDAVGEYRGLPPPPPSPRAQPPAPGPGPGPGADSFWSNPLVWLGLGGLAVYALTRAAWDDEVEEVEEVAIRRNPAPVPTSPVVPAVVPVMAQAPAPTVVPVPVAAGPAPVAPSPAVSPIPDAAPTPAPKPRRRRKTTQARDPATGTYLPAGTRKKPIVEGAK